MRDKAEQEHRSEEQMRLLTSDRLGQMWGGTLTASNMVLGEPRGTAGAH